MKTLTIIGPKELNAAVHDHVFPNQRCPQCGHMVVDPELHGIYRGWATDTDQAMKLLDTFNHHIEKHGIEYDWMIFVFEGTDPEDGEYRKMGEIEHNHFNTAVCLAALLSKGITVEYTEGDEG